HHAAGKQFKIFNLRQVLRFKQHDARYNTPPHAPVPDKISFVHWHQTPLAAWPLQLLLPSTINNILAELEAELTSPSISLTAPRQQAVMSMRFRNPFYEDLRFAPFCPFVYRFAIRSEFAR